MIAFSLDRIGGYAVWLAGTLAGMHVSPIADSLFFVMGNILIVGIIVVVSVSWADLLLRARKLDMDKETALTKLRRGLLIALVVYFPVISVIAVLWALNVETRATNLIVLVATGIFLTAVMISCIVFFTITSRWLAKQPSNSKTLQRIRFKNNILVALFVCAFIVIAVGLTSNLLPPFTNASAAIAFIVNYYVTRFIELIVAVLAALFVQNYLFRFGFCRGYLWAVTCRLSTLHEAYTHSSGTGRVSGGLTHSTSKGTHTSSAHTQSKSVTSAGSTSSTGSSQSSAQDHEGATAEAEETARRLSSRPE